MQQRFIANSGTNSIYINQNNTAIAWPVTALGTITASDLVVSGTVSGDGFSSFFDTYSVAALGAKEQAITALSPLPKQPLTTGANAGKTQLSLDTTAAYNVGSLNASGPILCGIIGAGPTALTIQNPADAAVAKFWNGNLLAASTAS